MLFVFYTGRTFIKLIFCVFLSLFSLSLLPPTLLHLLLFLPLRLNQTLQFRTEDKVVMAKDANKQDEDTYDIHDPRNPLNKRRREEGGVVKRTGARDKGQKSRKAERMRN